MSSFLAELRTRAGAFGKRFPPLFDACKRASRLLGHSDAVYECLRAFAQSKTRVSFLQIGSNDGISQDPLREFIVRCPTWEGLLIEPLPHLFEKLTRNYRHLGRNNLRYENIAVSDRSGEIVLFRVKSEFHKEFPSFVDQIASVSRSHILSIFPDHPQIGQKIEPIVVPALPIAEITGSFAETGIDLVHLDVEGHETIILQAFPFDEYLPEIIIFEAGHLPVRDKQVVDALLDEKGYAVFEAGIDAVALKKGIIPGCSEPFRGRNRSPLRAGANDS